MRFIITKKIKYIHLLLLLHRWGLLLNWRLLLDNLLLWRSFLLLWQVLLEWLLSKVIKWIAWIICRFIILLATCVSKDILTALFEKILKRICTFRSSIVGCLACIWSSKRIKCTFSLRWRWLRSLLWLWLSGWSVRLSTKSELREISCRREFCFYLNNRSWRRSLLLLISLRIGELIVKIIKCLFTLFWFLHLLLISVCFPIVFIETGIEPVGITLLGINLTWAIFVDPQASLLQKLQEK